MLAMETLLEDSSLKACVCCGIGNVSVIAFAALGHIGAVTIYAPSARSSTLFMTEP
jgi:hypothetical protein